MKSVNYGTDYFAALLTSTTPSLAIFLELRPIKGASHGLLDGNLFSEGKLVAIMGRIHKEVVDMAVLSLDLASIHFKKLA